MVSKKERIPVHGMNDWFSGVYIKPFGNALPEGVAYAHSAPHRHDFYYVVLIDQGELALEVDLEVIQMGNNSLFLSYPGQIHRIASGDLKSGWFLAFDPALLDEALKSLLDQFLSETVLVPLAPSVSDLAAQLYNVFDR